MTHKTTRLLGRLVSLTFVWIGYVLATNGIEDVSFDSALVKESSETTQIQPRESRDQGRQLLTSPQITFSQGYYDNTPLNNDSLQIAFVRSNIAWSSIRCDLWGATNSAASFSDMTIVRSWVPCRSPVNINNFPYDGSYNFTVIGYPLYSSNNVIVSSRWIIDRIAPVTTLLHFTNTCGSNTCIRFEFSATDRNEISKLECRINQEPWFGCLSPYFVTVSQTATRLSTFQVRAIDSAGNVNTAPTYHRRTVDNTPPSTDITSAVTLNWDSAQKRFYFSGNDSNEIDSYECKLDSGSWYECTSPRTVTVTGTSSSTHTFQVRAIDAYGNVDPTPATYTWRVGLTPPETTIVSSISTEDSGRRMQFSFTGSDFSRVDRFECKLNDGPWLDCTSPHSVVVSSTTSNQNRFQVRAIDEHGNVDLTPAVYRWTTVDTVPPGTSILSAVAIDDRSTEMQFNFTAKDPDESIDEFQCRVDHEAWTTCTSPITVTVSGTSLSEHVFEVRAVDVSGNVDPTPVAQTWTVQPRPPTTTLLSAHALDTRNIEMVFRFNGNSSEGVDRFQCRVDNHHWGSCTSPASFEISDDSIVEHSFEVRAIDTRGRVDPTPEVYFWTLDAELTPVATQSSNGGPSFPPVDSPDESDSGSFGGSIPSWILFIAVPIVGVLALVVLFVLREQFLLWQRKRNVRP